MDLNSLIHLFHIKNNEFIQSIKDLTQINDDDDGGPMPTSKHNLYNVLKEIKFWQEKLGVNEFHFEDLNPTVNDKRTKEFCKFLIKENKLQLLKMKQNL